MVVAYIYLALAIALEIISTSLIKASDGFTKWEYATSGTILFALCLYVFSLASKQIPLSIAYSIWCGVGMVVTAIVGVIIWHEVINLPSMVAILLIIVGSILLIIFN